MDEAVLRIIMEDSTSAARGVHQGQSQSGGGDGGSPPKTVTSIAHDQFRLISDNLRELGNIKRIVSSIADSVSGVQRARYDSPSRSMLDSPQLEKLVSLGQETVSLLESIRLLSTQVPTSIATHTTIQHGMAEAARPNVPEVRPATPSTMEVARGRQDKSCDECAKHIVDGLSATINTVGDKIIAVMTVTGKHNVDAILSAADHIADQNHNITKQVVDVILNPRVPHEFISPGAHPMRPGAIPAYVPAVRTGQAAPPGPGWPMYEEEVKEPTGTFEKVRRVLGRAALGVLGGGEEEIIPEAAGALEGNKPARSRPPLPPPIPVLGSSALVEGSTGEWQRKRSPPTMMMPSSGPPPPPPEPTPAPSEPPAPSGSGPPPYVAPSGAERPRSRSGQFVAPPPPEPPVPTVPMQAPGLSGPLIPVEPVGAGVDAGHAIPDIFSGKEERPLTRPEIPVAAADYSSEWAEYKKNRPERFGTGQGIKKKITNKQFQEMIDAGAMPAAMKNRGVDAAHRFIYKEEYEQFIDILEKGGKRPPDWYSRGGAVHMAGGGVVSHDNISGILKTIQDRTGINLSRIVGGVASTDQLKNLGEYLRGSVGEHGYTPGQMNLSTNKIKTLKDLAYTIGHELGHGADNFLGYLSGQPHGYASEVIGTKPFEFGARQSKEKMAKDELAGINMGPAFNQYRYSTDESFADLFAQHVTGLEEFGGKIDKTGAPTPLMEEFAQYVQHIAKLSHKYASGGSVDHPGGPRGTDTVPAWLTPGEVVVPTSMVQQGEVDHLRGRIPGFDRGGKVGWGSLSDVLGGWSGNQEEPLPHAAQLDDTLEELNAAAEDVRDAFESLSRQELIALMSSERRPSDDTAGGRRGRRGDTSDYATKVADIAGAVGRGDIGALAGIIGGPVAGRVGAAVEAVDSAVKGGIKSLVGGIGGKLNMIADPSADPSVPLEKMGEAISSVGDKIPILGTAAVAAGESLKVFAGLMRSIDKTAERYGEYSPQIAMAQGQAEVRQVMGDLRRSQEVGPELARYVQAQSDLQQKFEDIKVKLLMKLMPFVTRAVEILDMMMPSGQGIEAAINSLSGPLGAIPGAMESTTQQLLNAMRPPPLDPTEVLFRDEDRGGVQVPTS